MSLWGKGKGFFFFFSLYMHKTNLRKEKKLKKSSPWDFFPLAEDHTGLPGQQQNM